jgi:signal transduction histidine kinase
MSSRRGRVNGEIVRKGRLVAGAARRTPALAGAPRRARAIRASAGAAAEVRPYNAAHVAVADPMPMTLPTALLPVLALATLAAFGAVCAVAGALWARARAAAALQRAREDRRGLLALAECWIWETDADHRLTLWRAPAHRPGPAQAGWPAARQAVPAPGALLPAIASCAPAAGEVSAAAAGSPAAGALARQMDAHAPLDEPRVALALEGAGDARLAWTLRGEPRFDAAGRFAGYVGSARPAGDAGAGAGAPPAPAAAAAPAHEAAPAADDGDQESFIYSVSHDLRAPIRVVEGFARILKEDYGRFLDRIGNDHVDRILAAAARMNSMIDALLALSRLQSQPLKRQPVDLSQLARYVVDDLRGNEPEREADIDIEPGLVVHGDPTLIRIAVENLVGNAWKYSAQAPRTRIALRRETIDGQPAFVVADAGAGFDMRFADRLFGVFQRLHSAKDFQGTGVGLASVRRIVRRHGGDIWAESEVGKGARFYFTLPS